MKRKQFEKLKENEIMFSGNEILFFDNNFHRRRLYERQKKGYIKKIINGYYVFSNQEFGDLALYMISNNIYQPSYISLESALSYYHLISEGVFVTTAISTKKTINFDTNIGIFEYKNIKTNLFGGYKTITYNKYKYNMATIEKAIFDLIYLNKDIRTENDFEGLRLDLNELIEKRDENKLLYYANISGKKNIITAIRQFISYVKKNA